MMYIIPYYSSLESEINEIKEVTGRLRAFPALRQDFKIYSKEEYPYITKFPEHVEKIILDSGAFALASTRRKIDVTYMRALDQYYFYNADERSLCVAPDAKQDPIQSMYNFIKWHNLGLRKNISAVLQFDKQGVKIEDLKKQADFYRKYTDTMFIANSYNLTGLEAKTFRIDKLTRFLKEELEIKWIHILGAGFSLEDIQNWNKLGNFDSMDSIAYYKTREVENFGSLDPLQNIKNIMKITGGNNDVRTSNS